MASKDKPYKIYRGGRTKGPIRQDVPKERDRGSLGRDGYGGGYSEPQRKRRWRRRILIGVLVLVLLALVWALLGFLAFRTGVADANERLGQRAKRALTPQDGSLLTTPANILLLGADVGERGRRGRGLSDSIMLVRTDPDEHRIAMVSIPRDLRVEIPGHGAAKINAAYALGGPGLSVRTVEAFTGLQVNHVIVVDFANFAEVIDAVGGVTVNVRKPILSNKFACPRRTPAACARWPGWRFRKGRQEMDGRRAVIYARIRQNKLDRSETDIQRGHRQQQVIQALADEITSLGTFVRMPFVGDNLAKPLATDLSAGELLQLGWVKTRAADDKTLRCRLGGDPSNAGGASVLLPSEDNGLVIATIVGKTAPQLPPRGQPFAPGCFVGKVPS